ncbi:unnamed protein product [Danaus chrysippus]|uniref:(African queen) hypothetical protein n=1 Tax=Danaus chrysippus TaxID=151541 RepID=A0A8J2QFP4_9NEOP|nr:unnamed protein product [Danaus chrysippus]
MDGRTTRPRRHGGTTTTRSQHVLQTRKETSLEVVEMTNRIAIIGSEPSGFKDTTHAEIDECIHKLVFTSDTRRSPLLHRGTVHTRSYGLLCNRQIQSTVYRTCSVHKIGSVHTPMLRTVRERASRVGAPVIQPTGRWE